MYWEWKYRSGRIELCGTGSLYIPLISEMLGFPNRVMTMFHLRMESATTEQM